MTSKGAVCIFSNNKQKQKNANKYGSQVEVGLQKMSLYVNHFLGIVNNVLNVLLPEGERLFVKKNKNTWLGQDSGQP